jgi:hypothetical protein
VRDAPTNHNSQHLPAGFSPGKKASEALSIGDSPISSVTIVAHQRQILPMRFLMLT